MRGQITTQCVSGVIYIRVYLLCNMCGVYLLCNMCVCALEIHSLMQTLRYLIFLWNI